LALSKTAILAIGPRKRGFDVWAKCNVAGRNRVARVSACVARTYVAEGRGKVVRVLTKNGGVGGKPQRALRTAGFRLEAGDRRGQPQDYSLQPENGRWPGLVDVRWSVCEADGLAPEGMVRHRGAN